MNLVRKIKISKLTNAPLTGVDKEIVDFIENKLSDLIPFYMDNETTSIYYMKPNGDWILDQDNANGRLWVRYEDFWEVLKIKYFIDYKEVQNIIKYIVEQAFKQNVSTLAGTSVITYKTVEHAFKQKVLTPDYENIEYVRYVEEAFKKTYFNQ